MRIAIIIILALLVLGVAYYFLIYKSSNDAIGSECDPNKIGFQKDGTPNADCKGSSSTTPPVELPFNAGDDVYIPPLRSSYLYIYSYPQDNSSNEAGRITNALAGANSIGKVVSMAGNGRFVKVAMSGLPIEKKTVNPARPDSFVYGDEKISGEYYVLSEWVRNKPY